MVPITVAEKSSMTQSTVMQERSVHVFVKTYYFLCKLVHCRHSAVYSSVVQSQCMSLYQLYNLCSH